MARQSSYDRALLVTGTLETTEAGGPPHDVSAVAMSFQAPLPEAEATVSPTPAEEAEPEAAEESAPEPEKPARKRAAKKPAATQEQAEAPAED